MFVDMLGEAVALMWEFLLEFGFEFVVELLGEWFISRVEREEFRLKGSHFPQTEAGCRALAANPTSQSGRTRSRVR